MRSFASFARASSSASSIVKWLDLVCGGSDLVMVFSDSAAHETEIEMQIQIQMQMSYGAKFIEVWESEV